LRKNNYKQHSEQEHHWLHHVKENLSIQNGISDKVSWAAYHASSQSQHGHVICPNTLLPLFREPAHTLVYSFWCCSSLYSWENTSDHIKDQPLYALAKQIQGTWLDKYGEAKYVSLLGAFYIEIAV